MASEDNEASGGSPKKESESTSDAAQSLAKSVSPKPSPKPSPKSSKEGEGLYFFLDLLIYVDYIHYLYKWEVISILDVNLVGFSISTS